MPGSNSSPRAARPALLDEPLGLTVHALPEPREAADADSRRTASGRLKMLIVLAICAAPVIASYFTYYVVRPDNAKSFGELIQPQRPLPAFEATTLDGKPVAMPSLRGQWLLVSVGGGACDASCQRNLYIQRQLREGLGKDKDRVDWVWLIDDAAALPPEIQPALAQATVLRVPATKLHAWLEPERGQALPDHLFVIDPMGNWMMRFPAQQGAQPDPAAAKNMKRDIERLLRASAAWDQPGRAN